MGFEVDTHKFEGPLDLMLHLIREQRLDIFDLDMEILTDQYIAYLKQLEDLKLEVESEYLVELAMLIEYKSKKLLPKPTDNLEGEYEEDPKERLVRRLLEYQQYKEVTKKLYDSLMERQDQLSKPLSPISKPVSDDVKIEGSPNDLLKAMSRVLRRIELTRPIETRYTAKEISTEDRILVLKSRLIKMPRNFEFTDLLSDCENIHEVIVTFLALLDMAKDHILYFTLADDDRILLSKGMNNEDSGE